MRLTGEAVEHLQKHNWPGNVRELENTMARACALSLNDILLPEDIPLGRGPSTGGGTLTDSLAVLIESSAKNGQSALSFARNELIRHALDQSEDDPKEAARLLGVSLPTLRKWMPSESDV
jgi:DNA-binding NtrC family response regulator